MPGQLESRTDLRGARSLAELLQRARSLGVGKVLDEPLEILYEVDSLGARGADLLDEIGSLGNFPTVDALASDPRVADIVRRASPRQRNEVLAALATYLEAAAPRSSQQPKGLAELEVWAREHGVEAALDAPLKSLDAIVAWDDRRWLFTRARGSRIRDIFDHAWLVAQPHAVARALTRLQKAARTFVEREASARRDALAEEQARLSHEPPADPRAHELHERVRAARANLRQTLPPRNLSALELRHGFLADPPTFIVEELEWPHQGRATVILQTPRPGDPLQVSCSCTPGKSARCPHALTALDRLLEVLVDPGRRKDAAPILAELSRPHWARALVDLDRRLQPSPDADETRFAWWLEQRGAETLLTPVLQRRAKRGSFSSGSRCEARVILSAAPAAALDADREAAALLASAGYHSENGQRLVRRAILALVGHPRVALAKDRQRAISVRTGALAFVAREEDDGAVVLEPTVDGEAVDPARLAGTDELACLVDEAKCACRLVRVDAGARTLLEFLAHRGGVFPREAVPELAVRLPALGQRVRLSLSPVLRGVEVAADPRVRVGLELLPGAEPGLRVWARVQPLAEGQTYAPGDGPSEATGVRQGTRVYTCRDLAAEPARTRALLEPLALRADAEAGAFTWILDRGEEALDFLAALQARADDFVISWSSDERAVTRSATASDLRVSVADKKDWFGLDGSIEVGDARVPLAHLLEAIRGRRRYVAVKGGVWLRIADDLRARIQGVADHVFAGRGGLEVSRLAAPTLVDLLDSDADGEALAPRRLRDLVARIRRADAERPEAPPELSGALRDYQRTGFEWLARLSAWSSGACLADDMGLGKTIQALALLTHRAALGPALVVAPTSVGWNWMREMQRFAPSLRGILYREVDRGESLRRLGAGDVVVVSYALLANDVDELAAVSFATMILDEAQAIKNPATHRARAAATVAAKVGFRLALSGTPLENRLAELWSLMRVVTPGLLGSWEHFRVRFAVPIERDGDGERQAALARVVRPFILRRLKAEVAPELPDRIEIRENVTLSPGERALYDELRLAVLAELAAPAKAVVDEVKEQQRRFQVLTALLRLRQLACHPRLLHPESKIPSSKLERCLELIEEMREGGHRALVFSQFTSHLALVREALDAAEIPTLYLDGQTPAAKREELVDAFQRGDGDVFLISLKAGGTGLNLTAADVVIHLDPWWNPAVEDQATDRAHRIGQDRTVTIYRLVANGTIEEAILDLHEDKRRLVAGVLDGAGAATALTADELIAVLAGSG